MEGSEEHKKHLVLTAGHEDRASALRNVAVTVSFLCWRVSTYGTSLTYRHALRTYIEITAIDPNLTVGCYVFGVRSIAAFAIPKSVTTHPSEFVAVRDIHAACPLQ